MRRLPIATLLLVALQLTLFASRTSGATASYLKSDTTTEGSWVGVYGAGGYDLAGISANVPSSITFSVQNGLNYTWDSSTTDPRALVNPGAPGGIAATWYSPAPFSLDINFTDSATHQLELYAVDWDHQGRTETIQIVDAKTGVQLNSQTISNFTNGIYLVWNVSGNIMINFTTVAGANAVVSGVFFDGSGGSGGSPESVTVTPQTISLAASGTEPFSATVTNGPSQSVTWSIVSVSPAGANPGSFSNTTPGLYTAPDAASLTAAQVTVEATSVDQQAVGTATINLVNGATATSFHLDTLTQGSWANTYGGDGYSIAGSPPDDIPPYAALTVENAPVFTWATSTTDPRALQIPNGSGGIAEAWYSNHFSVPPTFSFDLNIASGTHQVALYALDWDGQGRAETIQIVDAVTKAQLDLETISNFSGGTYAVWNISGHVIINVTEIVGPNCVISGIFFGSSNGSTLNVSLGPSNVSLSAGQTQQFTASVTGNLNTAVSWSLNPSSGAGTLSQSGSYQAPSPITARQTATVTATSQADTSKFATATINLTTGATANFFGSDTNTQGNWQGIYGADGYALATVTPQSVPPYATLTMQGESNYTWNPSTTDPRALQIPGGSSGIAAAWYSKSSFSFNVVTDATVHQFALYALDWDAQGRTETIQIVDTNTSNVLDTRTVTNFANGTYLIWNISGSITINVTVNSGPNAVVSGVFFGGSSTLSVTVSPKSVGLTAGQTQQFTATYPGPTQNVTWSIASVTPNGQPTGGFSPGTADLYIAPSKISMAETVTVQATLANGILGTATVILSPGASASFQGLDATTQGNWQPVYGSLGYSLAGSSQSLPGTITFSVGSDNGIWPWNFNTTDPRALLVPGTNPTSGIAECWYKNHESFTMDVNFTDGLQHQIALYALDWDNQGRSESIAILDAVSGTALDTEILSNFSNGVYAKWNITGHVTINVTVNNGPNGVISGAFFQ